MKLKHIANRRLVTTAGFLLTRAASATYGKEEARELGLIDAALACLRRLTPSPAGDDILNVDMSAVEEPGHTDITVLYAIVKAYDLNAGLHGPTLLLDDMIAVTPAEGTVIIEIIPIKGQDPQRRVVYTAAHVYDEWCPVT